MVIPLEFYNHLREQIKISDIVKQKVLLTSRGYEYLGICPFHFEKTPSFTVNDKKKFYHCFGCNDHGDIIKFVAKTSGLKYNEAAIKIAKENYINLPQITVSQKSRANEIEQIFEVLELASAYFFTQTNKDAEEYLIKRGINKNLKEQFSIGYAPGQGLLINYLKKKSIPLKMLSDAGLIVKKENGKIYEIFNNRIIFPIRNAYKQIVGFGGRIIGNGIPKYINSPETLVFKKNEIMYGENIAINASYKKNFFILVEGYMDVIALHRVGIVQAVASLGTSVTEKHLLKLWRSSNEIIICLDADIAGERAIHRLIKLALPIIAHDKKISFIMLSEYKDPDEAIKREGIELFNKLIAKRINLSEAIWLNEYKEKKNFLPEETAFLEKKLESLCSQIKDKILALNFYRYFKNQIWQNFWTKKALGKKLKDSNITTYIKSKGIKNYNEIEVAELSLCSFIIKFPYLLKITKIRDFISDLTVSLPNFNEFKEWYVNQAEVYNLINEADVRELVEKTRFYTTFLVLSDPNENFLDSIFIEKNKTKCELIFDFLSKKYYFLLLKQEYINIANNSKEEFRVKGPYYLKEIQETHKQLDKLIEFFVK